MPFNGSGVFTRVYNWVTDKANSVLVTASRMDTEDNGFATGLSNCMTRDGQSPPSTNIPMGGFRITGVAAGIASTDAVIVSQIPSVAAYVARAYRATSNQSTSAGVSTKIQFNTVVTDPYSEWDTTVNYRWTPVATGLYLVELAAQVQDASAGTMVLDIKVAGAVFRQSFITGVAGADYAMRTMAIVNVTALSQYVEGFYTATGAGTIRAHIGTAMTISRLGNSQ